jgi:succinate-semialdehyde dehydrogenase/glutarate-semialdehyde dehydrogenase
MPYRSVNPTTGDVIRTFPNHTGAEIESPVVVAHSVYHYRS